MTSLHSALEILLKTALLGTGREGAAPPFDGELRAFGESKGSPESGLLGAAAATTLGIRAGGLPSHSHTPAIAPCPEEAQPYFSPRPAALLDLCLSGTRELLPQALAWAARSGHIAPPILLPRLLELGRGSKEMRRSILPILGERGRWLAQLNPDWQGVAAPLDADLEASWQDGEPAARREALRLKREEDPGVAREWVEAVFKTEGAKERAAWLETLEIGLSQADEVFLESALDDKSREVRAVAVSLLKKLPGSRLIDRAKAELEPLLRWNAASQTLEVELPVAWKKEWARDGLEEKAWSSTEKYWGAFRDKNIGERAARLQEFLRRVPLSHWETQWDTSTATIVTGTPKEWREMLLSAWWQGAHLHQDVALALKTLAVCDPKTLPFSVHALTPHYADALALALFERGNQDFSTDGPLFELLRAHPGPWNIEVARRFLQQVQKSLSLWHGSNSSPLNQQFNRLRFDLPAAADKFPVDMAGEAAQGWPQADAINEEWQPIITQFLSRLQFRADLQAAFAPLTSTRTPNPTP